MSKDLQTSATTLLYIAVFLSCSLIAGSGLSAASLRQESSEATVTVDEPGAEVVDQNDRPEATSEQTVDDEVDDGAAVVAAAEQSDLAAENEGVADVELVAAVAASGQPVAEAAVYQFLSPEIVTKLINPLIILFLAVCFLTWLLALMTPKSSAKRGGATDSISNQGKAKSSKFGQVFPAKPKLVDDLTKIGGVDSNDARRLNEAGVWQYSQLRNMTVQQRTNLQQKLNLPGIRWYSLTGLSGIAATSLATESRNALETSEPFSGLAESEAGQVKQSNVHSVNERGSDGTASEQFHDGDHVSRQKNAAIRVDEASATSALRPPKFHRPTETQGSSEENVAVPAGQGGLKPESVAASNAKNASIPTVVDTLVHPVAESSARLVQAVTPQSASSPDILSGSVSPTLAEGDRHMVESFGFNYTSTPMDPDDLTRLAGIDAETAARLNAAGIFRFDQLKELDDSQITLLVENFQIRDADVADWRRCIYAWGRGIDTTAEAGQTYAMGSIHGIQLPQIADGVFDGARLVAYSEQVIFRGENPEVWGRDDCDSDDGAVSALSFDSIRSDINYLRIRRVDTRESVVIPMTKDQIFASGDPDINGWNGSCEVFFGGRHIGVCANHLPQEVETRFGQGGWGFGHRYDHNDRQEWGWAGRVIEPTAFEISVGCIGEMPRKLPRN
ncbi:hypothetical protein [Mariniblastus fucicola]|uniref:Uncharacterized protein n=1 Tax=Mariniblastus fucicola TaxID=980251 RepID=A0A5B9PID7_9BACT|nr:hypothetical protein [Mariniblastus fucicola]QEG24436.1 30S ribosomal protein S2/unknown domain fusion protein [Mariniblastus fucicola]